MIDIETLKANRPHSGQTPMETFDSLLALYDSIIELYEEIIKTKNELEKSIHYHAVGYIIRI